MSHTPGPWTAHEFVNPFGTRRKHDHDWGIHGHTDNQAYNVAITEWIPGGVSEANARLIAAAPDMLEALEWLVNGSSWTMENYLPEQLQRVKEAITKAKGDASVTASAPLFDDDPRDPDTEYDLARDNA